jgi:hypothetical protein
MEQILEKIKLYQPRQIVTIRVCALLLFTCLLMDCDGNDHCSRTLLIASSYSQGMQYEVGDFVVKVGSITLGDTTRGVILEVEYRPCMIPNGCPQILQSFIGNLGPFPTNITPFATTVNYSGVREALSSSSLHPGRY